MGRDVLGANLSLTGVEFGGAGMAVTAPPRDDQVPTAAAEVTMPDDAREHAIAALKRKRKFAQDSAVYIAVNGLLWVIWALADRSTDSTIPWPAWVSIVWGFFLALDGWRAYAGWPKGLNTPITESEIEREIERTRRR
jgi:hypothetical protein